MAQGQEIVALASKMSILGLDLEDHWPWPVPQSLTCN